VSAEQRQGRGYDVDAGFDEQTKFPLDWHHGSQNRAACPINASTKFVFTRRHVECELLTASNGPALNPVDVDSIRPPPVSL